MKKSELTTLIKESVREVFREEIKELVLEAIKSNKTQIVSENQQVLYPKQPTGDPLPKHPPTTSQTPLSGEQKRKMYLDLVEGMDPRNKETIKMTTANLNPNVDTINGTLPEGEVGLELIQGLMGNG